MTYGQRDIFLRIKAALPASWFGENTPILDAILIALSAGWVSLFGLLGYVQAQTRIVSASELWLDLVAEDYFGRRLSRRQNEEDLSFRSRIEFELIRDRCTRSAICEEVQHLTGRAPTIFEPTNPNDTGCYGSLDGASPGTSGYCVQGGWGNMSSPFQVFVKAHRPLTDTFAMINGWGGNIGAFGEGCSAYASSATSSAWASDAEIGEALTRTAPAGTVVWLWIEP